MNKKDQERQEAYNRQCEENVAKGLTRHGFTRTFEGEEILFYLNNIEITCAIDYGMECPHLEFKGEPNVMTETGYRSHFSQVELSQYPTLKEVVEAAVGAIMREELKKKIQYSLTWDPSDEYLRHSPVQLSLSLEANEES